MSTPPRCKSIILSASLVLALAACGAPALKSPSRSAALPTQTVQTSPNQPMVTQQATQQSVAISPSLVPTEDAHSDLHTHANPTATMNMPGTAILASPPATQDMGNMNMSGMEMGSDNSTPPPGSDPA